MQANYNCVTVTPEGSGIVVYAKRDVTDLKVVDNIDRTQVLASCEFLKEGQTWRASVGRNMDRMYALSVTCILLSGDEYTYTWPIAF